MSDQAGAAAPGWHPDPYGRHEYRYWNGAAWSDQVSDAGVVATDPAERLAPGLPGSGAPPDGRPTAGKARGGIPVGVLALLGLAVAAGVVVVLVFAFGGGDDDGTAASDNSDEAGGDFAGSISASEPYATRPVDLDAGEVVRVVVRPSDDLDVEVRFGVPPEAAANAAFTSLFGDEAVDEDALGEVYGDDYADLFSGSIDSELRGDLDDAFTDEPFSDFQDQLSGDVPALGDAGIPLFPGDEGGPGDPEGNFLLAPVAGTYSVIVSGDGSEGGFEATIETAATDASFVTLEPDDGTYLVAYYGAHEPHLDFICDEGFLGGDPEDVLVDASLFCDPDGFDDLLADASNGFSDDASSDFSDSSSDFSDDASSDFSDLSDDFSSDAGPALTLGNAVAPARFIDEFGTDARFDRLARRCFLGNLDLCDQLYAETPVSPSTNSYEGYGATCGGRLPEERPGTCATFG